MTIPIKIESYILQNEMEIDVPESIRKSMARIHQNNVDRVLLDSLSGEFTFVDKWKVCDFQKLRREAGIIDRIDIFPITGTGS